MKRIALLLFPLCLFGLPLIQGAQAQFGPFVEKGFGVGGGFSQADDATSFGGTAGYVIPSTLEFGLSVQRSNADDIDFTRSGVGPYVTFYPLDQVERFPISMSISGGYTFDSFSGDEVDQFESSVGDLSGNTITIEGSLFRVVEVGELVEVIPAVGVTYTEVETETSFQSGTQTETESTTSFGTSVSFSYEASENFGIVVTPSASFSDDSSAFGLSASLVLPR